MEHFEHVSRSPFLPGAQFAAEFRELGIRSDLPGQRSSIISCQSVTAHASTQTDRGQFQAPIICSLHDGGSYNCPSFSPRGSLTPRVVSAGEVPRPQSRR